MHESPADLERLQLLLDKSYSGAGRHLLSIHTPERRLDAAGVAERLQDVCLLVLATVTADGRPVAGAVDGIFYRGEFYFGSADDSVRLRHIRERPQVSAVHAPREQLAVTVHGRAVESDLRATETSAFRQALLDVYVPRYGPEWEDFIASGVTFARITAERMFAFAS